MTRLVIIEIANDVDVFSAADESISQFAQLFQVGCFGTVEASASAVRELLVELYVQTRSAGKKVCRADTPTHYNACPVPPDDDWALVYLVARHSAAERQCFDDELGSLLESLDDDAALFILTMCNAGTNFVLAANGVAANGAPLQISLADLASTLADLTGVPLCDGIQGNSLRQGLESESAYSAEDEQMVYERLAGLGYIG